MRKYGRQNKKQQEKPVINNWRRFEKYQGVKEFHMLARIGSYCKIMVFGPFKLEVTYYPSFKGNKWLSSN